VVLSFGHCERGNTEFPKVVHRAWGNEGKVGGRARVVDKRLSSGIRGGEVKEKDAAHR